MIGSESESRNFIFVVLLQVPFCLNIRQKLQEQRRSQNRRADMMMRRRMDMLSAGGAAAPGTAPGQAQNPALQTNGSLILGSIHGFTVRTFYAICSR